MILTNFLNVYELVVLYLIPNGVFVKLNGVPMWQVM